MFHRRRGKSLHNPVLCWDSANRTVDLKLASKNDLCAASTVKECAVEICGQRADYIGADK